MECLLRVRPKSSAFGADQTMIFQEARAKVSAEHGCLDTSQTVVSKSHEVGVRGASRCW